MATRTHHEEFSHWLNLCRIAFAHRNAQKQLIIDTLLAVGKIHAEDPEFIQKRIQIATDKQATMYWYSWAEFVRAKGILHEQNSAVLSTLLQIGFEFTKSPLVLHDNNLMLYIKTLYDIIFHQVDFEEEPEESRVLFFQLTAELLDDKYQALLERDGHQGYYGLTLYFIIMCDAQFEDRKEEFLQLYERVKFHLEDYEPDDVLRESWEDMYRNWTSDKG